MVDSIIIIIKIQNKKNVEKIKINIYLNYFIRFFYVTKFLFIGKQRVKIT